MKVRVGVGMGASVPVDPEEFATLIDDLDDLRFDSIWLSEVLTAPAIDPLTALAFAAAHNSHLKLGTTMLLPGRNVVRVAKELATVDRLSKGRLLVTFVPGLPREPEIGAVGVEVRHRGRRMDEVIPVLRRLWAGECVSMAAESGTFTDVTMAPLPHQDPLEVWTGGMVPAALRRCGTLADGWLPAACTPEEASRGRGIVEEAAAMAGRAIDPEHFGVSLAYSHEPLSEGAMAALRANRPGLDPERVIPVGLDGLRRLLEEFITVGFSKFVVRPLQTPDRWRSELEALATSVLDLQT